MQKLFGTVSRKDLFYALVLMGIAVAGRLLPHPANFTPVAAAGILAFALIQTRWLALLVPAIALTISNFVLPLEHPWIMLVINLGFLLPAFLGARLKDQVQSGPFLGRSVQTGLISGLVFFVLSNLAVFFWGGLYPFSLDGLLTCYALALPFLWRSLAGDVFFVVLFVALARQALRMEHARLPQPDLSA